MKTRIIIYADEGKVLTNGKIFGKQIYLSANEQPDNYYEITDAEYQSLCQNSSDRVHDGEV